jgi:hypothetical protein
MRFMMMVKSDERSEAGVLPDEKMLASMGDYNEQLIKAGLMLAGEGLQASSKGARVLMLGGKIKVIDGPFAEAKELLGGYWLVQATSKDEVIDWTKRVPFEEGEVEVREVYDLEDFPVDPAEKPDGWRDREQAMRDRAGATGSIAARKPGTQRYMIAIKGDKNTEAGAMLDDTVLFERMGALLDEMASAGVLLSGDGLKPSSKGARVRFSGAKRTVTDGPFTEAKELIAGFSIVQVNSKQEAIEWARRMLVIHVEGTQVGEGTVEVRQLFEIEDFPVDPAEKFGGWRDQELAFRDRSGQ